MTLIRATGDGANDFSTLSVTGGDGNLDDDTTEVHLRLMSSAGEFAQGWFRLDELLTALGVSQLITCDLCGKAMTYLKDRATGINAATVRDLGPDVLACGGCYYRALTTL